VTALDIKSQESDFSDPTGSHGYYRPQSHDGSEELSIRPSHFKIDAYPNPFNPSTVISYQLSVDSIVNLAVYDLSGREIAMLVDGWRSKGLHEVTFDGSGLASGMYIYRMTAGDFEASKKMVLVR
jgi:hypothetical protein